MIAYLMPRSPDMTTAPALFAILRCGVGTDTDEYKQPWWPIRNAHLSPLAPAVSAEEYQEDPDIIFRKMSSF